MEEEENVGQQGTVSACLSHPLFALSVAFPPALIIVVCSAYSQIKFLTILGQLY